MRKKIALFIVVIMLFQVVPPSASIASDQYAWVLVETQYRIGGQWENSPLGSYNPTNVPSGFSRYANQEPRKVEIRASGPARSGQPAMDMRGIYTWGAPQSQIQPSGTFSITANQNVVSNVPGFYNTRFSMRVMINYPTSTGHVYLSGPADLQGKEYRTVSFGGPSAHPTYEMQGSGSVTFSTEVWAVASEGTRRAITVEVSNGNELVQERYVYESRSVRATDRFSDLAPSHWAYETIMEMVELGILSGYPDGTFRPNNTVTRAEFATIMVRALDLNQAPVRTVTFADVPAGHWAHGVVEAAKEYLTGYRDGRTGQLTFEPNSVAVREDVAVAMVKAQGVGNVNPNLTLLNQFSDQGQISPALRNHVAIAVEYGYMRGTNIGFEPQKALTRAEACALLSRIIKEAGDREKVAM
ncbi:S-layer homology domain-containing protein [Desulfuribacillus alkaliarsenatis]|uniref:SLH domain-containing protein n=1 Tax=Desulfuribacillus alkaliarsenatis TaxID=766136 RepID=A0A1E5G2S8_9FIRM|nr:S-layer homology domain-containing protein [Desulfuribacillus alkaliarsenatis]OEF97377.1 hypothetical protein BHF68_03990 [Desulfuribacillus alkaliarsenatis]